MHIDSYDFGKMVIDGSLYTSDVILVRGRIIGNWWRASGHRLAAEDLKECTEELLDLLVVGTGMFGRVEVPEETIQYLKEKGIEPLIETTKKAYKIYNEQADKGAIAGAFHLTC